ncbi:hypothetical protein DPMN_059548 [Dreissena polymorpha]|uniref:Uncharacterized protein n=1 Tax=Dreissena polymorpha TaxID=45954 RepID=A0A9D4C4D9_DREPO|nr:hypothetical protein DPMN_059548 [Dreissena polymorpha]
MQHEKSTSCLKKTPARRPACFGQAETFYRARKRHTKPPLNRRLLRPSNQILHDCCESGYSRKWRHPCRPDLD